MTFPGYVKPTELLIDVGVLYARDPWGSAAIIGVGPTRGGLTFNPNRALRNVPFDGKQADIEGLDRYNAEGAPTLSGGLIDFSRKALGYLEPGSSSADSGSMARVEPIGNAEFLAAGAYLKDLLWIRRMKDSTLIDVVGFPAAIVVSYEQTAEEKNEAIANVTIAARVPEDATNIEEAPYRFFRATSISALDALFPSFWNVAGYVG